MLTRFIHTPHNVAILPSDASSGPTIKKKWGPPITTVLMDEFAEPGNQATGALKVR